MRTTYAWSRLAGGAVLASTCALLFALPRLADACGATLPELHESVPADGDTYPANAALLFWGDGITLDKVTVTVDGEPAALVDAPLAAGLAPLAAKVEPEPQPGQTVVVAGEFCGEGENCPASISFIAGARDVTAPSPDVEKSFFAVFEHAQYTMTSGCDQFEIEQTLYVHLEQPAPTAGEALPLFVMEWDPGGEFEGHGLHRTARGPSSTTVVPITLAVDRLGGADVRTDVCLEVVAIDAAGNAAAPFELCPPCFVRTDEAPQPDGSGPPDEPVWSDADAVPGSACAAAVETTGEESETGEAPTTGEAPMTGEAGSETGGSDATDSATGGEDGPEKGCACASDGTGGAGWLALFGLLGLRRRRRA
ncbi:MYXO-CTERM sorting domain-containing protein [Nannocystis bainbridge]|uniref:MYXO-CTERM sorting domain-containing protein n=1 Tax=Nannocystis bainbridge TaxID=2995303 RepID=A0ABT5E313_9BACT|nr:MYXO-CTERM sorting domain-containing protein [Nannocystis bainbridge]MDC0720265.1 MYXO-CTERM sorting domain-containing protein [Nannocystis bainbridge]